MSDVVLFNDHMKEFSVFFCADNLFRSVRIYMSLCGSTSRGRTLYMCKSGLTSDDSVLLNFHVSVYHCI